MLVATVLSQETIKKCRGPWAQKDLAMYYLANSRTNDVVMFGPFKLFVTERLLRKGDEALPIGGRALALLTPLVERAGRVIAHNPLLSPATPTITVAEPTLRVHTPPLC